MSPGCRTGADAAFDNAPCPFPARTTSTPSPLPFFWPAASSGALSRCWSRPQWPRWHRCSRPLCALPSPWQPSWPGACGGARAGLLAGALFASEFACIYIGLQYTTASRLTVFLYCSPFWVALLLPRFVPGEGLRGWQWLGLAGAFAGVGLAMGDGLFGPANAAL